MEEGTTGQEKQVGNPSSYFGVDRQLYVVDIRAGITEAVRTMPSGLLPDNGHVYKLVSQVPGVAMTVSLFKGGSMPMIPSNPGDAKTI